MNNARPARRLGEGCGPGRTRNQHYRVASTRAAAASISAESFRCKAAAFPCASPAKSNVRPGEKQA